MKKRARRAAVRETVRQTAVGEEEALVDGVLDQRRTTHGEFTLESVTTESIKHAMKNSPNWHRLDPHQMTALDTIALKIARILHGDPDYDDHWVDIGGYVKLVVERLPGRDKR